MATMLPALLPTLLPTLLQLPHASARRQRHMHIAAAYEHAPGVDAGRGDFSPLFAAHHRVHVCTTPHRVPSMRDVDEKRMSSRYRARVTVSLKSMSCLGASRA